MKRCFIRLVPNYYSIHQKFVRSKGILSQIENIAALTTVTDTSNQDQNKQKLKVHKSSNSVLPFFVSVKLSFILLLFISIQ